MFAFGGHGLTRFKASPQDLRLRTQGTSLKEFWTSMLRSGGLKGVVCSRRVRECNGGDILYVPLNEPPAVPTPSGGSFKLLDYKTAGFGG